MDQMKEVNFSPQRLWNPRDWRSGDIVLATTMLSSDVRPTIGLQTSLVAEMVIAMI